MNVEFGQSPYQFVPYGAAHQTVQGARETDSEELNLRVVLMSLKDGDLSAVNSLRPFLASASYDVRQYAHQLFAHVCNHEQVSWFLAALPHIEDLNELLRVIVRLGETLSGNAVHVLQQVNESHGHEPEVREHILLALRLLGGSANVDEAVQDDRKIEDAIDRIQMQLASEEYFYKGRPIFIGDVTKEFVTATLTANRDQRPVVLGRQHILLANFTGLDCPIQYGQSVSSTDVDAAFSFVKQIANGNWKRGVKYFYRHEIS